MTSMSWDANALATRHSRPGVVGQLERTSGSTARRARSRRGAAPEFVDADLWAQPSEGGAETVVEADRHVDAADGTAPLMARRRWRLYGDAARSDHPDSQRSSPNQPESPPLGSRSFS
jgi:hypothetical protein